MKDNVFLSILVPGIVVLQHECSFSDRKSLVVTVNTILLQDIYFTSSQSDMRIVAGTPEEPL